MGIYAVPEEIRKFKPKGTMVKAIHGKYYVYEYSCIKVNDKWKTKTGKMIGTITPDLGFISNENLQKNEEITCFNFGEYFLTYQLGMPIYEKLCKFFNIKEANEIYLLAIMHFVNGFTYVKHMKPNYDISYFSKRFPSISLSEHIVSKLLENLGSHTKNVEEFEQSLVNTSSKSLAVDGHSIKTSSKDNELTEKGNKYLQTKSNQMNALMAYDIKNNRPVFSRIYAGGSMDNVTFKDLFKRITFKDTLFVIDKGFNDPQNIKLCSKDGNKYVVPVRGSSKIYKKLIEKPTFSDFFVYKSSKKNTVIYYNCSIIDNKKIIIYKDVNESVLETSDYLSKLGKKYTLEKFNKAQKAFGVIILQSNLEESAEEIYKIYKNRWKIETFYDYYKNKLEVDEVYTSNYYRTQGLSFILLITALIHSEFVEKTKSLKKNVTDILLDAKFVKMHYKKSGWELENLSKRHFELFENLNIDLSKELEYFNKLLKNQ